jgi:hypothetical protein
VAAQTDKQVQQLMDDLKKNTKISVDEGFFGPPLGTGARAGAPGAAPAGQPQSGQQPPQPGTGGNPK